MDKNKNKEKKVELKYVIRNVTYGDKKLIDCMKEVIKMKLNEN